MDPLTHVVTGVAISQFVPSPSRAWGALAGVLFAILPDLDYVMIFGSRLSYLKHHRGFTHSVFALVLFVFLGAFLGRLLGGPRWFRPLVVLGTLVLASHLFLDWTTSYGTQLLNPLTRAKFSLDWVFIIDPYLTGLVLVSAAATFWSTGVSRTVGAVFLGLAGLYILICGFYHHQALNLARQVFQQPSRDAVTVAALPQPLSPRRWLLMAARPGEVRQAFVELPFRPGVSAVPPPPEIDVRQTSRAPFHVPPAQYHPPEVLEVYVWRAAPVPATFLTPEISRFLDTYLEFCRFPIMAANDAVPGGVSLYWLDLRFSVPGRSIPFVLSIELDHGGRLRAWQVGGSKFSFHKSTPPSPRPG